MSLGRRALQWWAELNRCARCDGVFVPGWRRAGRAAPGPRSRGSKLGPCGSYQHVGALQRHSRLVVGVFQRL